jgi:hypothetical protein
MKPWQARGHVSVGPDFVRDPSIKVTGFDGRKLSSSWPVVFVLRRCLAVELYLRSIIMRRHTVVTLLSPVGRMRRKLFAPFHTVVQGHSLEASAALRVLQSPWRWFASPIAYILCALGEPDQNGCRSLD